MSDVMLGVEFEADDRQSRHVYDWGEHGRKFTCCQGDDNDDDDDDDSDDGKLCVTSCLFWWSVLSTARQCLNCSWASIPCWPVYLLVFTQPDVINGENQNYKVLLGLMIGDTLALCPYVDVASYSLEWITS